MKRPRTKSPPLSVPRLDSLLHRLQHAPGAEDSSYLNQLMIFLDDPPPRVSDRWKEGARMCSDWGIACTGASVWRLYRSYALEWRLRLAQEGKTRRPLSSNLPCHHLPEPLTKFASFPNPIRLIRLIRLFFSRKGEPSSGEQRAKIG